MEEIKNYQRQELFDKYHSCDNPFIICTVKVDVTEIVKFCQVKRNFYATFSYIITKTINEIEEFKYRYKDGKIYYCDVINTGFTEKRNNEIGYFTVPFVDNIDDYLKNYSDIHKKFLESNNLIEGGLNEAWVSCVPWFSFDSLIPPFKKDVTIPQFIWDKYENLDGKYYLNLMIMTHHGFTDGYHVGKFIELLNYYIDNIC